MRSLSDVVAEAARRLETTGLSSDESGRDAALLARSVLGWDQAQWLARRREPASPEFTAAYAPVVSRRALREPLAYILGEREFYGRAFVVSRAVLVPRPETELVVEQARHWLASAAVTNPVILDVGTGSGCLAVTIALEWPAARLVATDVSSAAVDVARANAARHGADSRIEFRLASLTAGLVGAADVIVANPPYVAERDRATLPPEVREYEPPEALFGGPDGLELIRALAPAARQALRPDGVLIMEVGAGQWPAVRAIVEQAGFTRVRVTADLAGIPRVVVGQRARLP